MVYIYQTNGVVMFTRGERPTGDIIELERMIPKPVRQGFNSVLHADFQNKKVWYDLVPISPTLNEVISNKLKEITAYDISSHVNSFILDGRCIWLDKDTRVGLMNSIKIEKSAGRSESSLWLGEAKLTLNCDVAIYILSTLELYALECYNRTAEHKANVTALTTIDEVMGYDYTIGYPNKLNFNL